ncbi:nicotinate-nucleotide--dimethylbenzimidazole phosphoribosyltransferase [Synechococcus sp. BSF8S]|uniref:nicotinate-nucleotide--dimethylbenzimidazole phosphoribosyltransferase n=1 Tax=Synechococcales TaxID=1890424 RepID=UPI001625C51C|nr:MULTISPECIES: nicotinate-nucleotide--dimethylbenzimidazole phosphoribosyltransferase [unclassified Synechococcus]MBC1261360.1 nicotinate-nucleotide--dimethylbenzimidazole phosphoribosyltransferase [Synechococcus sp. BSF8S]MBC1264390.1 nicotinate-nucleotide--dimethylbenzimidazole phosphoribosyltransferase [Synechococcus sp. BSA11S]
MITLCGDPGQARRWCERLAREWSATQVLLLLAGTDTAAVPGISAAGATPEVRRRTAAADAELLLLGPGGTRPHALPPLPAGVSPALISHVVCRELALVPLVTDLGCPLAPAVPHLRLGGTPARCLSSGAAMPRQRVERLVRLGLRWGERWGAARHHTTTGEPAPVLIAECVPGGTSTAQAVLTGLGVEVAGLVSGSLRQPVHALKSELTGRGLAQAGLGLAGVVDPLAVLAAVGDPMQALAAGVLLGTAGRRVPVLLAGGSQMAAVLALALALAPPHQRPCLAEHAALGTTAWVAQEPGSNLALLLERLGERWGVIPIAFASSLRFGDCRNPALRDYERGYVKEGVGAGGLALLWELTGRSCGTLATACDRAMERLQDGT